MPGQQQKPATRSQETTSKPGEASNAATAANTAAKNISPSPPKTANPPPPPPPNQMAKDISSIYALLRETSESQERKLNSIQSATRAVEAKLSNIATRLNNVESRIDFLEDAHQALETNPPATQSEVEILENRSRWNNLRFVGFPEGCEGPDTLAFLRKVIPQMLNIDLQGDLEIDRAHRTLARRRPDDQPPRPIVACFLRFQDKERIAEAARKMGKVHWDKHHIMVFPDYSKLVTEKRAAFNQCKRLLHERRIKFSVMYPAVLSLRTADGRREFTDPKKALEFIRSLPP